MGHDVFVCHASGDRDVAQSVVAELERNGVSCWIAPRDVPAGANYAQAILTGIGECRMLVLVFSANANRSPHVSREVERAVSRSLPLLPLRTEDVAPEGPLEYFISSPQWIGGADASLEESLHELTAAVLTQLGRDTAASSETHDVSGGQGPVSGFEEEPRQKLRELVARFGAELADDPRRVRGLLRDVAGEYRREISALVVAAEEGVGRALLDSSESLGPATAGRLATQLNADRALSEDAAAWAVEAWANALDVRIATVEPAAPQVEPPPAPAQPAEPVRATPDSPQDTPPAKESPRPETTRVPVGPEPARAGVGPRAAPTPSAAPAVPKSRRSKARFWAPGLVLVGALVAGATAIALNGGDSTSPTSTAASVATTAPEAQTTSVPTTTRAVTTTSFVTQSFPPVVIRSALGEAIAARGEIRLGVHSAAVPPFSMPFEADLGFEIDLAIAMIREIFPTNVVVTLVPLTAAERFSALAAGDIDLLARTTTRTTSREELALFTDTYLVDGLGLLVRSNGPIEARFGGTWIEASTLDGATIGVPAGTTTALEFTQYLDTHDVSLGDLLSFESFEPGAVALGQVDGFATSWITAVTFAEDDPSFEALLVLIKEPIAMAVPLGNESFVTELNEAMRRVIGDGRWISLYEKYLGPSPWTESDVNNFASIPAVDR